MSKEDLYNLSDEDFLKSFNTVGDTTSAEDLMKGEDLAGELMEGGAESDDDHTTPHQSEADEADEDAPVSAAPPAEDDGEEAPEGDDDAAAEKDSSSEDPKGSDESAEGDEDPASAQAGSDDAQQEEGASEPEAKDGEEAPNYQELYNEIMAPFKANGRDFTPANPAEAKRLMQQGANYTKKMQGIAPHLKMIRMLENNDLLSEDRLNHLIDVAKGSPDAIRKLLQDSKIDPLDLDMDSTQAYKPGNHQVSDQEMLFKDIFTETIGTPEGKATVSHIENSWDDVSKQAIYQDPQILSIINDQRSNGIYAKITDEIEREKVLGRFANTPFIQAYKEVGDRLYREGKLAPAQPQPATDPAPSTQTPQVLEVRPATKPRQMSNGEKAKAVSNSGRGATNASTSFDPLKMSDEEIMSMAHPPS